jgi:quercetin dioxygenase-like cupin family protein
MAVERWDAERDGPFSETALRRKLEALGCVVSKYVYEPGTHFPEHSHHVDKIDAVVSGRFQIAIAGQIFELGEGDWISVPRGVRHAATVIGNDAVISLDGVIASSR